MGQDLEWYEEKIWRGVRFKMSKSWQRRRQARSNRIHLTTMYSPLCPLLTDSILHTSNACSHLALSARCMGEGGG